MTQSDPVPGSKEWSEKYCNQLNEPVTSGNDTVGRVTMRSMCGYPTTKVNGDQSYCDRHAQANMQANVNLHSTPVPAHRINHTF